MKLAQALATGTATLCMITAPVAQASPGVTANTSGDNGITLAKIETRVVHLTIEASGYVVSVNDEGKTVRSDAPTTFTSFCSGSFVGSGIILTADHCINADLVREGIADSFGLPSDEELEEMTEAEIMEVVLGDRPEVLVTDVQGTNPMSGLPIPGKAPDLKITAWQRQYLSNEFPGEVVLDEGPVEATVIGSTPIDQGDVALLKIPLKTPYLPIAHEAPAFDTTIYSVGYPGSVSFGVAEENPMESVSVMRGSVGLEQPYDIGKPGMHVSSTIGQGMSGGPVVAINTSGQPVVVGVNSNGTQDGFNYAATTTQIQELLRAEGIAFATESLPVSAKKFRK